MFPSSFIQEEIFGIEWWGSVRRTDRSRVAKVETGEETDTARETHNTGKDAAGDTGGRDALHQGHCSGDRGTKADAVKVVAGASIADDALEVAGEGDSLDLGGIQGG